MATVETDRRDRRFRTVAIIISVIAALILLRYGWIMVGDLSSDAGAPGAASTVSEIQRGPILDREGRILAIQTRLDTVTGWRPTIDDPTAVAARLGDILGLEPRSIYERIAAATGFIIIQRTITPTQSEEIAEARTAGLLPGIRLVPDMGRSYPQRETAAPVIGYAGVDNVGLAGIEYMYTGELYPTSVPTGVPAMGNQVFLTLDLGVQTAADELGARLLAVHDADAVMIIVAEARTGAILAMSSQPSFDPNNFRDYTATERRNRAVQTIYEPGSVFKVFSIAAFLELGGISATDRFDTSGGYVADDGGFRISDLGDYGIVSPAQIIQFSSNVGAAYASEQVDSAAFHGMLRAFGFGQRTGIDLNGEERGLLAPPESWSGRTQQTLAIGQEIGVTALQIVAAATALANDGVLVRPRIVDRIVSPTGETIRRFDREPGTEVLSPGTARLMLEMMEGATGPGGTARRISVEGVRIAAKTGTAEVFDPATGTYSDDHFIASTLALVPADRPEIITYVVIDYPRGEEIFGGRLAAPATDELLEFLVPYIDIPREGDVVVEHSGRVVTTTATLPEIGATIPNFVGLPVRTLVPLLSREDLMVRIVGSGYVVRQEPAPGTPFAPGMTLRLFLE